MNDNNRKTTIHYYCLLNDATIKTEKNKKCMKKKQREGRQLCWKCWSAISTTPTFLPHFNQLHLIRLLYFHNEWNIRTAVLAAVKTEQNKKNWCSENINKRDYGMRNENKRLWRDRDAKSKRCSQLYHYNLHKQLVVSNHDNWNIINFCTRAIFVHFSVLLLFVGLFFVLF